ELARLRVEVAESLGRHLSEQAARRVSWPLLRLSDRGLAVQAAQHLLRAVGLTAVPTDGRFDLRTVEAVRRFQTVHRTEEVNGMIGGESWPLLVTAASAVDSPEVELAARALSRTDAAPPDTPGEWMRLLDAAARA
ncbi:MAG: peptidoglycan-binding domain-containing protein, partial [Pseudonocardia sp.]